MSLARPSDDTVAGRVSTRRGFRPVLDPANPPPLSDREGGAGLIFALFGVLISPRTIEAWPLGWRLINGRAYADTAEMLSLAKAKIDAAPVIRGGRNRQAA